MQEHARRGDWQGAVKEGLAEFTREVGRFTAGTASSRGAEQAAAAQDGEDRTPAAPSGPAEETARAAAPPAPEWAGEPASGDPARDFDRLLDRFRDDLRDAARDHGVTAEQLKESRRRLSTTAAHIGALLRDPERHASLADPDGTP